jgi:hypothetical protein
MTMDYTTDYDGQKKLKSETVKYGRESQGDSDPRMTALARVRSNCKRQTRPLVRESAPYQQARNCPAYSVFRLAIKI